MTYLAKFYRQEPVLETDLVPQALQLYNGFIAALTVLPFPVYRVIPNTDLRELTGTYETPKVALFEVRERFAEANCTILGKLRSEWIWEARLRFNNSVMGDQLFGELALEPIALASNNDTNYRIDPECKAFLVSVDHNWRPSQDPGPGSSFDLRFEVRSR